MQDRACIDMFGEEPFEPVSKETVAKLSESQEEMILQYDSRQSQMVNRYIKGEERSFTIIAYPVPEIGEQYEEIFDEIIRINTLDAKVYEKVQQTLIDALDQGRIRAYSRNEWESYRSECAVTSVE